MPESKDVSEKGSTLIPWTWTLSEKDDGEIIEGPGIKDSNGDSIFTEDVGDYMTITDGTAKKICDAVNAYDKHRNLIKKQGAEIALFRKIVAELVKRMDLINTKCVYIDRSKCPNHALIDESNEALSSGEN